MSHSIGRPNDDLLDVMLGQGADPEQAFISDSQQGLDEGGGFEDGLLGGEPTVPELKGLANPTSAGTPIG